MILKFSVMFMLSFLLLSCVKKINLETFQDSGSTEDIKITEMPDFILKKSPYEVAILFPEKWIQVNNQCSLETLLQSKLTKKFKKYGNVHIVDAAKLDSIKSSISDFSFPKYLDAVIIPNINYIGYSGVKKENRTVYNYTTKKDMEEEHCFSMSSFSGSFREMRSISQPAGLYKMDGSSETDLGKYNHCNIAMIKKQEPFFGDDGSDCLTAKFLVDNAVFGSEDNLFSMAFQLTDDFGDNISHRYPIYGYITKVLSDGKDTAVYVNLGENEVKSGQVLNIFSIKKVKNVSETLKAIGLNVSSLKGKGIFYKGTCKVTGNKQVDGKSLCLMQLNPKDKLKREINRHMIVMGVKK